MSIRKNDSVQAGTDIRQGINGKFRQQPEIYRQNTIQQKHFFRQENGCIRLSKGQQFFLWQEYSAYAKKQRQCGTQQIVCIRIPQPFHRQPQL